MMAMHDHMEGKRQRDKWGNAPGQAPIPVESGFDDPSAGWDHAPAAFPDLADRRQPSQRAQRPGQGPGVARGQGAFQQRTRTLQIGSQPFAGIAIGEESIGAGRVIQAAQPLGQADDDLLDAAMAAVAQRGVQADF